MNVPASFPIVSRPTSVRIRGRQVIIRHGTPEWWHGLLWVDQELPYPIRFYGRPIWRQVVRWLMQHPSDLWYADFEPNQDGHTRFRSPADLCQFKAYFGDRLNVALPVGPRLPYMGLAAERPRAQD